MLRSLRVFLSIAVMGISLAGSVWAVCPEGDVYEDCEVNWRDLKFLADHWLEPAGSEADVVGGDGVDFADFARVVEHWLDAGDGTGLLSVTILPAEAIDAGAMWRVDGGGWHGSGDLHGFSVGFHALEFAEINGWTRPRSDTVHIREGKTTALSRMYDLQTGGVRVTISPQGPIDLGAKWRIAGDMWRSNGEIVTGLPLGFYKIQFSEIGEWVAPADQNIDLENGLITDIEASYKHPLVINELLASNNRFNFDPQSEDDDWIELYNAGAEAINTGGMHLTDNLDNPTKWRIPTGNPALTTILPGGHLLIWADGDEEDYPAGLHAGFEINAGGDKLGLFDSNGAILIDSVKFPEQDANVSYGRYPDGNETWQFFPSPSPGSENIGAYDGFVSEVKFSHDRGFYDSAFTVTLACETEGADIYFSMDGTEPGVIGERLRTGYHYSSPFTINKTTCLRARAIKSGWKPSETDTQTYIFINQVVNQPVNPPGFPTSWGSTSADYEMDPDIVNSHLTTIKDDLKSLPTMSVVMNLADLFDTSTGIYTNWGSRGDAWERPGSIEYFGPDDPEGIQVNCGVRLYGGVGRREQKKTLRLVFKGAYGPAKLRYPLFGEMAADEFDTIILRANFNDGYPWGAANSQFIRDEWMRRTQQLTGHPSAVGSFVHLYINGVYWGMYNPTQRPDTGFSSTYYDGDKDEWDGINSGQPINESPMTAWNALMGMCSSELSGNEGYQKLQGNNPDGTDSPDYEDYLDMDQYIDFLMVNFYGGNNDWGSHNWYVGRRRGPLSTGWKSYTWDAEWVLGMQSGVSDNSVGDTTTSNWLLKPYTYLRNNPEFRLLFADHAHRAFFNGGPLYVDSANPSWNPAYPQRNRPAALYVELADTIERAMVCETARWGDVGGGTPYTVATWRSVRDSVLNSYMSQRSAIVLSQLRSASLYPNINAPVFYINGLYQHGGHISSSDVFTITGAPGTVYYTTDGCDPRTPVTSQGGTTIKLVAENAAKRVLVPTGAISDNWRGGGYFNDSVWTYVSGNPGGVGYERSSGFESYISIDLGAQMYNTQNTCYIRIPFTVDAGQLAGLESMTLRMRYDDGFVAYINGTLVASRNFTGTPVWNSGASGTNPDSSAVVFEDILIPEHLGVLRAGDNVLAVHGMNNAGNQSDFLISAELVVGKGGTSSGGGVSPTAVRYDGPLTFAKSTHIKARALSASAWSALNEATYAVGPVAENLRITEILYHPQETGDPNDPNEEFIELKNVGGDTINLSLVRFTNGIDFTFPNVQLAPAGEPGGHVVVVKDISAFAAAHPGFSGVIAGQYAGSLDNEGERIELVDAAGQTILNFRYGDGWRSLTDGQGFSLTIIDPTDAVSSMPDDGLVAHWKFDEGSGTTATDSAGSNSGTIRGGAAWTTGRIGGALRFDGSNDDVSFAPVSTLAGNSVTVSCWVRLSGLTGVWNPVLTQSNAAGDGYYLYIYEDKPMFALIGGGGAAQAVGAENILWNEWYQLAGTNDGSSIRIYVDAGLKGSASSVGRTGVSSNTYVASASGAYYSGLVDDVRIYNRALSKYEFGGSSDPLERWSRKDSWRSSAYAGGSPGEDDSGIIPNPGAIVINELLAHSHAVAPDWIELYNTTDEDIDVGGWYLSDTEIYPKKYKFADGTKIRAYDYLVLHEDANFGEASKDPGRLTGFGFSENGDNVYLRSAEAGILTGYREAESFGASYTGVSFGRYFKRSTGSYNFVHTDYNTPGWTNAYPEVGPIVINEIMYNPDWPVGGNYTNDRYEYIELRNITAEPVTLYRFDKALPWKFTEGIEFVFPAWPSAVTIAGGDHIVVVKDPNAFTWRYPAVPAGKIFGPYTGQLANDGEQVELSMPGDIDKFGRRHYIRIDRVGYSDGSHPGDEPDDVDLWPVEADGGGKSLARKVASLYGNDPNNWIPATPSPGGPNP